MVGFRQRLAGYGASRGEGSEPGGAGLCPWALVEPRDKTVEIDGRSDRRMLQMGLASAITMPF